MGNNIDLGAFAQTVSSVRSGAQGLAKEQRVNTEVMSRTSHMSLEGLSFPVMQTL